MHVFYAVGLPYRDIETVGSGGLMNRGPELTSSPSGATQKK